MIGRLIERLLDWLFKFELINIPSGDNYVKRWILCGGKVGRGIYLHKFSKSDYERHLHDHPWPFVSFLLKGSYMQHTRKTTELPWPLPAGENQEHIRWINARLDPTAAHRISIDETRGKVWTLVFHGKRMREWGFLTERGWVSHREYHDLFHDR